MDHRDFEITGLMAPKRPPRAVKRDSRPGAGSRWWRRDPKDIAAGISADLSFWKRNQRWRLEMLNRFARLYGNKANVGYSSSAYDLQATLRSQFGEQVSYNVTGSVVDTLVSMVTRNNPRVYFLSNDGDRKAQRIAKNRNTFICGVFEENQTYALGELAFQDSCVEGDGIIQVHAKNGRVHHSRRWPGQLVVDEVEALTARGPRQLHMVDFYDREQLMEENPDQADEIEQCKWDDGAAYAMHSSLADLVCVRDSWHLPSTEGGDDGMYVRTIGDVVLGEPEKYKRDRYPFARIKYGTQPRAYWGKGVVEQGESIQLELDRVSWCIQENVELAGAVKVFLPTGSNISPDQITNAFVGIIEGGTLPPVYLTPPIMPPEVYQYQQQLIDRYFSIATGVSQSDAASSKPAGDLSGEAIRLVHDIGTQRFIAKGKAYERFYEEIARLSIWTAQDILEAAKSDVEEGKKVGYTVIARVRGTARTVDFAELEFKPGEEFRIQAFPVSMLPSDPEGRTQKTQDYAQAGWIDGDTARDLIDFPDTGRVEGLHNASRDFIARTLDAIVDGEKFADGTLTYSIEPFDDAPLFYEMGMEYYQRYKMPDAGVSDERLQRLRDIILDAKSKLPAMAPAAPDAPANAAPPPVSPLLPNAPQRAA